MQAERQLGRALRSPAAMEGGAFILVLALAVALAESVAPAERKCQLSGLWTNDQDSQMEISVLRENGDFHGQYLTRVTLSGGCARVSPLRGAQQQLGGEGWPTFAFTVLWDKFSNATTAFVGQCFVDAGGKEMLSTTWLLRQAVGSLEEDWKATRVGRNVFTRKRTPKGKILPNLSPLCEAVSLPGP